MSPDLLKTARDKGIKKLYSNYQELCKDTDIDSVSICLPNFLHAPAVIEALEAGKHVLCEKPLAPNLEDGKRIAEAARIGLGIEFDNRHAVIGIEDSGAGVVAIRLAGFAAIGMQEGNIEKSGTKRLLHSYCPDFNEVLKIIDG